MRKALVISYHFPPDAAVGALRVQKMCTYFKKVGIEPVVLTVGEDDYPNVDPARLSAVADLEIHRCGCPKPPVQALTDWIIALKRKYLARSQAGSATNGGAGGGGKGATGVQAKQTPGLLKRLLITLSYLPDDKIFWGLRAIPKGVELAKKHDFTCVVSSAPPHSISVIASLVARKTGLPLVLDYRDPWTVGHVPLGYTFWPSFVKRWFESVERKMLQQAELVVLNNDKYAQRLAQESDINESKIMAVYNGHDMSDAQPAQPSKGDSDKVVLAHFGTLYLKRNPEAFFRAVGELNKAVPDLKDKVSIEFYGHSQYDLDGVIAQTGCADIVSVSEPIPYAQALEKMRASDVLLAFAEDQPFQIPAKMFEYIGMKKAILLCGSEGATSDLLDRLQCGVCIPIDDAERIRRTLSDLLVDRQFEDFSGYDNSSVARELQLEPLADRIKSL